MILHQSFAKSMTKKSETNMKVILRFRRFRRFQSRFHYCNSEAVCLSFKKNIFKYYFISSFGYFWHSPIVALGRRNSCTIDINIWKWRTRSKNCSTYNLTETMWTFSMSDMYISKVNSSTWRIFEEKWNKVQRSSSYASLTKIY